ncbi:class I SAM-dependent methyltransferase [Mesorhizobium sp. LHD-90]|uniref:class I SAM-dependent methyltransferase n=1 Tax=Mesorhizobium sp. LHD-90 TaxID=3071414 RepID=UPI0027E0B236|nr:class I SAM-dependent methyltransferase [Mesorhizobium sp. LHD-90]MDQ6436004.1 class I SAM-dependent methyltransferase [Mesorhizobium sp. LHD-90]
MNKSAEFDTWSIGQNYDFYMGRWSRQIADNFLDWLAPPRHAAWLDLGCGTGALTTAILARCAPRSILSVDPSEGFLAHARAVVRDERVRFEKASAQDLPAGDASFDVAASALVLNFVPDMQAALAEMRRVLKPGGLLAFYVWDYPGGGMGFIDAFWKAAAAVDESAGALDEGRRFPFCTPDGLAGICQAAGLVSPVIDSLEIETVFPDFEAFWLPFTLGAGPAPGYCTSQPPERQAALKQQLAQMLGTDRPISLVARAWAVKARWPE